MFLVISQAAGCPQAVVNKGASWLPVPYSGCHSGLRVMKSGNFSEPKKEVNVRAPACHGQKYPGKTAGVK